MAVCFDEGDWQAYLDGEVGPENLRLMDSHLAECADCQKRLGQVRGNQDFAAGKLSAFLAAPREEREINIWEKKGVSILFKRYKNALAPAAAILLLLGTLSFAPARTVAGNLLGIFRVETVQTISISQQDVSQLRSLFQKGGQVDISNFGRIETSGRASWRDVSAASAGRSLGVQVPKTPSGYLAPTLRLSDRSSITMTLDVKNINAYLSSLGDTTLLPAALAGKPFTLSVPPILTIEYAQAGGERRITVAETKSPALAVPEGVDPAVLRNALLSIPGLPSDLTAQLAAVSDWQHTLLIPSVAGTSTQLSVGGAPGVFVTGGNGENTLLFEKNDVIYTIHGSLTRQEAIAFGRQLI